MRWFVKILAFIVLFIGVCFVIWLAFFFNSHNIILTPDNSSPDMNLTGSIGDFVGGVVGTAFSFAATLLVVVTLLEQTRQNKRNLFVQNYYEMLHVHADHVRQMSFQKQDGSSYKGREVFTQFIKNYNTIYDCVDCYIQNILNGGAQNTEDNKQQLEYLRNIKQRESLTMRLAYGYFLYGTDSYSLNSYQNEIEKNIENNILSIGKGNQFYTEGHHVSLGHYYRHMYQMVSYVIKADCLSEEERYVFTKQLRAQMDDEEQLLLYYDAMADCGKAWLNNSARNGDVKKISQMCPLARFRMIKNIPASTIIKGLDPKIQFAKEIEIFKKKNLDFFEQR
jgi:hypothetical protein